MEEIFWEQENGFKKKMKLNVNMMQKGLAGKPMKLELGLQLECYINMEIQVK